jgi:hypothetical protein
MRYLNRSVWAADSSTKCTCYISEQIIRKLKTPDHLIAQGQTAAYVFRVLQLSQPTYHHCRHLYGGKKEDEVNRHTQLEKEYVRIKRLWQKQSSTRRCTMTLPRKTPEPGASPASRNGPARALPGI